MGVFLVMLPDIIVYLVLIPLEIAMPDIGRYRSAEEPYILNVCIGKPPADALVYITKYVYEAYVTILMIYNLNCYISVLSINRQ